MRLKLRTTSAILLIAGLLAPPPATAQGNGQFTVTITNLTRDQTFTPVFVATHRPGIRLFEPGQPALPHVALVAEEGDVGPLMALARAATPFVHDVTFTGAPPGGFVGPGESRTITVGTRPGFDRVSVIAMLIPTNDGFFALRDAEGPSGTGPVMYTSPAYDAGSERNDETCASVPGPNYPECGGPGGGGQPSGGEEGYVYIHPGIQGVGDFGPNRDWRNPVAQITIRRVP